MAIQLLGFPTALGLPRKVHLHGPEALRKAGLVQRLERLGQAVIDLGDLPLAEPQPSNAVPLRVRKVVDAAGRQAALWQENHRADNLMLTLGGDHSTSLGTIQALSAMGHDYDIVWVDAHGDFNILDTSPSGNPHGMVLSLACGLMPEFMPKQVSPAQLHLWGIRDLDTGERTLLKREGVEVLSPDQVRHEWERIVRRLKPNVFLSFDCDSVEPAEAPGTMTPVPGGFRRAEALELVAYLARHRNLLAVDIVEFHPDRDQQDLTADLALSVVEAVVSGQVSYQNSKSLSAAAGD